MDLPSDGAGSLCQRPTSSAVTDNFAEGWRFVDTPLRRYLGSLGVKGTDVDDIAQETAVRAIESGMHSKDPTELRRWAFVVARRLVVDLHRVRRRTTEMLPAVERDLAQEDELLRVENRHLLRSVLNAVAALQPHDRRALAIASNQSPAERNRAKVARYRARRRLRDLVGPLAVVLVWPRRHSHLVVIGGAAVAAVLPPLVLPALVQHGGGAPNASASRRYNSEAATQGVASVGRARPHSVSGAAKAHALWPSVATRTVPTSARHSALIVHGPSGTRATAFSEDKDGGHKPLFCTHGSAVDRCIDLPRLPPELSAPA